jgi:transcription elongation factor Elf1
MALIASVRRLGCSRCGDRLIAPEVSEFVNEEEVRHHWCCGRCGHEFETTVQLSCRAVDPRIIEQFFPSLLVA